MTKQISPDMTIESIFSTFPGASQRLAQVMSNAGLHCAGCHAATWETLEEGMKGHGKSDAEVKELVSKLNKILEEDIDVTTIAFTPRGAEKFKLISKEEGKPDCALRFGLMSGGCNGFEYELDFADTPDQDDEVFQSEGIDIYVKKDLLSHLLGSLIDYVEGLAGSGFKVANPNVKASCGCGNSQQF